MATLIDSVGTQHYANKMVLAENRKVGSKSLPSALADVDKLIDEMKSLFEGEYGSSLDMKLENNENVFSVGTGSGVNKRGEVENSFTDIEVKGKSLVNIFDYKKSFCSLYGDAILTNKTFTKEYDGRHSTANRIQWLNFTTFKPNTSYTLIYRLSSNIAINLAPQFAICDNKIETSFGRGSVNISLSAGVWKEVRIALTTNSSTTSPAALLLYFSQQPIESILKIRDILILEGDYSNKTVPQFFEGVNSTGEEQDRNNIEVLSTGKNLFKAEKSGKPAHNTSEVKILSPNDIQMSSTSNTWASECFKFICKPDTEYTFSCNAKRGFNEGGTYVRVYDKETHEPISEIVNTGVLNKDTVVVQTFRTPSSLANVYIGVQLYCSREKGSSTKGEWIFNDIMLEEGPSKTEFESSKIDRKQILLNEPLRGVSSDARDTIEKINGEWKLVRRCVQFNLNGSEAWYDGRNSSWPQHTNVKGFYCYPSENVGLKAGSKYIVCDKHQPLSSHINDVEGIYNGNTYKWIGMSILKTKLAGYTDTSSMDQTVEMLKKYLSENPVTVVMALENPVIEDIDPVVLQCWKNGSISLASLIAPVTTHTIALSKPAQIKRNIEELTALRERVLALEEQYDQITLEQAHKLDLLNHSFELDYNI